MKIKRTFWSLLFAVAWLAGSLPAASAQTETTLVIAYIGASTGAQAVVDRQNYQAAVLAAEQINAPVEGRYTPGVTGPDGAHYTFEIVYYEGDNDREAVTAYANAIADGVVAVLGPDQGARVRAIVNEGQPAAPMLFGAMDVEPEYGAYRVAAGYDAWAESLADYLVNERHLSRIAVVAADTSAARTGVSAFVDTIEAMDAEIVVNLTHDTSVDTLYGDAEEIRDTDADAVLVWTLDAQAVSLLQGLRDVGWDGVVIYTGLDSDFIADAGADLAVGVIGPVGWSSVAKSAAGQAFVEAYQERWGETPPNSAAAYYDATRLLALAVAEAGDDPDDITRALDSMGGYKIVQGVYTGAETSDFMLVQASASGKLIEAARFESGVCANCPDIWFADTSDEAVADEDVVALALIATLEGAAGAIGRHAEQGAELAIREINAAGGIIGPDDVRYFFTLQTHNTTSSDEAAAVTREAAAEGADIILGPDYNAYILPNLALAQAVGVPQLVSATNARITTEAPGNYVFQIRPDDGALAGATATYLLNTRGMTDLATVAVRLDYALSAIDAVQEAISDSADGRVVLAVEYDLNEGDFAEIARQIAASGAEAVLSWNTPVDAQALLTELGATGWTGTLAYGYLTPTLLETLTIPDGIDLIGPVNWWPAVGDAVSQNFVDRYMDRYNELPAPQSPAYYDAVYLIAHAIQAVGAEPADIQSWLTDADTAPMQAVQGTYRPVTSDQARLIQSVYILEVSSPDAQVVARYDGATCLYGCGEVQIVMVEAAATASTWTWQGPLDPVPTFDRCYYLDQYRYACTGWISVYGGYPPYWGVTIQGQPVSANNGAYPFTVVGTKCAIALFEVTVHDSYQELTKSFAINPSGDRAYLFPGGRCQ